MAIYTLKFYTGHILNTFYFFQRFDSRLTVYDWMQSTSPNQKSKDTNAFLSS